MRSHDARTGRPRGFWPGVTTLTVLAAAAVVVVVTSVADAAERRSRGASSVTRVAQHRAIRNPGIRNVRPSVNGRSRNFGSSRINRISRGDRPGGWTPPSRGERPPRHPGRPPHRGGRGPNIPGIVVPGVIGIIGAIATEPEPGYSEPVYDPPPPRRPPATNRRPARRQPPTRATRSGPSGVPPAGEQRLVPDEIVIQLPAGASPQVVAQVAARHQLTQLESQSFQLTGETMYRWRIPDQRSVPAVIAALEADAGVLSAQPNHLFALAGETNAVNRGDPAQYAVSKLHLPEAHALAMGDKVLVGVIDSGIDVSHPELKGMIAETFDTLPGEAPHSHGTGMAGTIVARARLLGVAPRARILAARAFGAKAATAQATTFNILKSIDWAAKNGARVINMSFAGPRDPAIARELTAAYKKNVTLVAAAGNAGPKSPPLYPAADPHVIAVAATDARDNVFNLSNRGDYITIAAPGVDIIAPAPRGGYQITSGTSVAAAFVSGLAALLIERKPNLTPSEVRGILQSTARDLGKRGRDPEYGAGLADAYGAVKAVQPRTAESAPSGRR